MEFVTFELAKKIKEKGYPQRTFGEFDMMGACYFMDGRFYKDGCIAHIEDCCTAPQIHEVLKWLRKEKKIHIYVDIYDMGWFFFINKNINTDHEIFSYDIEPSEIEYYDDYDTAMLMGIEYVLDNLI